MGPPQGVSGHRAGKAEPGGPGAGLHGGPGGMGHHGPRQGAASPCSQDHIRDRQWSPLPPPPHLLPLRSPALREYILNQRNAQGLGKGLRRLLPSWHSPQSQLAHGSLSWPGEGTGDRSRAAAEQRPSPASSPQPHLGHKFSNTGCWQVERDAAPAAPAPALRRQLHAQPLRLRRKQGRRARRGREEPRALAR